MSDRIRRQPELSMTGDPLSADPVRESAGEAGTHFSRRRFLQASGLFLALRGVPPRSGALLASPQNSAVLHPPKCTSAAKTVYPPLLERFIQKLDPASDDFPSEVYAAEISNTLARWTDSLRQSPRETSAISSDLSEDLAACSWQPSRVDPLRSSGALKIERRFFQGAPSRGQQDFLKSWSKYLSTFAKLDVVELEIFGVRITSDSPLRIETDLRCDLVGSGIDGSREQRVGSWVIAWRRNEPFPGKLANDQRSDPTPRWTVEKWIANSELRSSLIGPGFREITTDCLAADEPGTVQLGTGIDDWRGVLDAASGIDVYGNHGIAVGDIDGSGFDSFYVCQPSGLPNRLYRNRGDGTFEDITEHSGTGILDGTASALFVDFQNRGKQDLLVVRTGGPLLFSNAGHGRFEPQPDAFHFARPPQGTFTSAAVVDYNRDGLLDIYLCVYSYYQGLNQYQFPSPYYDAQNGPPNFLFRNRGDGTFEDVTVASGMDQNNNRFSFAAAWCDFDNDGWPDLYVANDFGRKNLYHNNGDGTFTDAADRAGVEDYGPGMSTCWIDYDNDGLQDVYVANMWLPEGKRITENDRFLAGVDPGVRALYRKHNAGNSLYRNASKGSSRLGFEDKTADCGAAMGRWSWSCATWDFDNDGYSDLYVANGFVSGVNRFDLQSFFWRQVAQRSMSSAGISPEYEMAWNAVNELIRADYSWSGYQRNVFYANNHDGTFSDISGVLGLDLIDDSRAYGLSDFDHDGRLEFVLKNRTAPQLRILRNDMDGLGNSIVFRLTGRDSNRDAIGATITIEAGAPRQTKFVSAGSGFASQHTKELFFGVGEVSGTISISVRWPNGTVQRHDSVPVNHRVEIEEGRTDFRSTGYKTARSGAGHAPASLTAPPTPSTVSTWLISPLFGPDIKLPDLEGETRQLGALKGHPVLLTFFRLDCGESRKQLEQIQTASASLTAAGISVLAVAITINGTLEGAANDKPTLAAVARSLRITFPILMADDSTVGAWNIQYRYLFDRRRDLVLPLSFLLDKSGAIIRVYQGLVAPQGVIDDWKSAPTTSEARFARAMPFPGPYYGNPIKRDYFTYGIAFVEYGYANEAQAAFQRVVDDDPNHAGGWFNLGTIYLNKKNYSEARRCLAEAVRLNPNDADAWNNLGMISGEEEKYDEALEQFRQAARANPDYMVAVENMVRIYQYQARPAEAQKALEELVARRPNNSDLHLGLAMALVGQNEIDRAREELELAVRLRPSNTDALNNLGAILSRMGLKQDALARFDECRRLAPDFDRPVINASVVYKSLGQPAKARAVLEEFSVRHPDNADVQSALDKLGPQ